MSKVRLSYMYGTEKGTLVKGEKYVDEDEVDELCEKISKEAYPYVVHTLADEIKEIDNG